MGYIPAYVIGSKEFLIALEVLGLSASHALTQLSLEILPLMRSEFNCTYIVPQWSSAINQPCFSVHVSTSLFSPSPVPSPPAMQALAFQVVYGFSSVNIETCAHCGCRCSALCPDALMDACESKLSASYLIPVLYSLLPNPQQLPLPFSPCPYPLSFAFHSFTEHLARTMGLRCTNTAISSYSSDKADRTCRGYAAFVIRHDRELSVELPVSTWRVDVLAVICWPSRDLPLDPPGRAGDLLGGVVTSGVN